MTILIVIISLSLLILVHEAGHFFAAKFFGVRVDEFGLGFPPRIFGKKIGETTYSINLLPLGGFVKIYGEDSTGEPGGPNGTNQEDERRTFSFQPAWKKSVIILAGVVMNVVLGWLALSLVFLAGSPKHLAIADVALDSPAREAGLEAGDIILGVEYEGGALEDPVKSEDLISVMKNAPASEVILSILRSGDEELRVVLSGRASPPEGEGPLGVALIDIGFDKKGFFGSVVEGFKTTGRMLGLITVSFYNIITRIFVAPEILNSLTGPIGIFVIAKEAGALGLVYLMQISALISLNLAVLNLIPFPALDGGRFLMIIIEKIKGSPVPQKFQMAANAFGFVLLIVLMVFVTIKDVGRFIL